MSQRRNRLAGLEATEGVTQCGDAEKQGGLNLPVRKRKEKNKTNKKTERKCKTKNKSICTSVVGEGQPAGRKKRVNDAFVAITK